MIEGDYKVEYYLDRDTNEYHIDILDATTKIFVVHLYVHDKDALNRNLLAIRDIYNVVEEEDQGEV